MRTALVFLLGFALGSGTVTFAQLKRTAEKVVVAATK